MPYDDPTQPWNPPYQPTPQPKSLKEWIKLIKWVLGKLKEHKPHGEYPRCQDCGQRLEVIGFKEEEPIWGCLHCNSG